MGKTLYTSELKRYGQLSTKVLVFHTPVKQLLLNQAWNVRTFKDFLSITSKNVSDRYFNYCKLHDMVSEERTYGFNKSHKYSKNWELGGHFSMYLPNHSMMSRMWHKVNF